MRPDPQQWIHRHVWGGRSEDGAESSHLHFLQNLEPLNFPDAVVIQIDILK